MSAGLLEQLDQLGQQGDRRRMLTTHSDPREVVGRPPPEGGTTGADQLAAVPSHHVHERQGCPVAATNDWVQDHLQGTPVRVESSPPDPCGALNTG
jgi:hypothetical protein